MGWFRVQRFTEDELYELNTILRTQAGPDAKILEILPDNKIIVGGIEGAFKRPKPGEQNINLQVFNAIVLLVKERRSVTIKKDLVRQRIAQNRGEPRGSKISPAFQELSRERRIVHNSDEDTVSLSHIYRIVESRPEPESTVTSASGLSEPGATAPALDPDTAVGVVIFPTEETAGIADAPAAGEVSETRKPIVPIEPSAPPTEPPVPGLEPEPKPGLGVGGAQVPASSSFLDETPVVEPNPSGGDESTPTAQDEAALGPEPEASEFSVSIRRYPEKILKMYKQKRKPTDNVGDEVRMSWTIVSDTGIQPYHRDRQNFPAPEDGSVNLPIAIINTALDAFIMKDKPYITLSEICILLRDKSIRPLSPLPP